MEAEHIWSEKNLKPKEKYKTEPQERYQSNRKEDEQDQ